VSLLSKSINFFKKKKKHWLFRMKRLSKKDKHFDRRTYSLLLAIEFPLRIKSTKYNLISAYSSYTNHNYSLTHQSRHKPPLSSFYQSIQPNSSRLSDKAHHQDCYPEYGDILDHNTAKNNVSLVRTSTGNIKQEHIYNPVIYCIKIQGLINILLLRATVQA